MLRLLMGGSPCTHWSIAQTKNRETEPSGLGWELFKNYVIAREKFKPDYFLYENNRSMSSAIREQISQELGVGPVLINSALVSAQSRQRLYWAGKREPDGTYSQIEIEQPEDRGILLRDILDSGMAWKEKAYTLKSNYFKSSVANAMDGGHYPAPMAMESLRIGTIESGTQTQHDSKPFRVYSPDAKSVTLQGEAGGYGAKTGLYATPVRVGTMPNDSGKIINSQSRRIYSQDGKAPSICASRSGGNCDVSSPSTRLYAVPVGCDVVITDNSIRCQRRDKKHSAVQGTHVNFEDGKTQVMSPSHIPNTITKADSLKSNSRTVYEVKDGLITIKDKQYPIKLADGFYIIRKLTVAECKRLQTVQDDYVFPVSDTQAYRQLGNGWTVDVIAHLLSHMDGITSESLEVLSMFDGMSCGHIALDKLGADVAVYYATEIDKYAIQTTMANYPDTIQLGDAFQVREDGWTPQSERTG